MPPDPLAYTRQLGKSRRLRNDEGITLLFLPAPYVAWFGIKEPAPEAPEAVLADPTLKAA
jgi:hypothetical protein